MTHEYAVCRDVLSLQSTGSRGCVTLKLHLCTSEALYRIFDLFDLRFACTTVGTGPGPHPPSQPARACVDTVISEISRRIDTPRCVDTAHRDIAVSFGPTARYVTGTGTGTAE
jgi:hypothetical protein